MRKHAVIVGLNKYKNISRLNGCVNDARFMQELATYYNYTNIITLTDEAATKANITEALSEVIDAAKGRDRVLYYHSGHGTQKKDTSGDEWDGFDEVLCQYDFTWADPFLDDDLAVAIKPLKSNCILNVVIDTCNSGTMTDYKKVANRQGHYKIKTHPMPAKWQEEYLYQTAPKRESRKFGVKPAWKDGAQRHTLLAACRPSELSAETVFGGKIQGIMTKCIETETQAKWRQRNLSWQAAHVAVKQKALTINSGQHAKLEGPVDLLDDKIFGKAHWSWTKNSKR